MRPYYEQGGVTIYHGDCREVLLGLGRHSVDLLVTDPPYGVSWAGTMRKGDSPLGLIVGDDGTLDVPGVLGVAFRALRRNRHAYIFGRFDMAGLPIGGTCELIWDKVIPGPSAPAHWQYQHEYITFTSHVDIPSGRARGDGRGAARLRRGTVLRYQRPNAIGAQRHPTEKPVALLRELIESSSKHGETVLDPFAGSGSTLVAAFLEGRKAIGIEIEERYCEVAAKRLAQSLPLGETA